MIKADFIENANQDIRQFTISGHAEFDEPGKDIVCSAVTALSFSTINSIDELLDMNFDLEMNQTDGGYLKATFKDHLSDDKLQLLLESLYLGLFSIQDEYADYLRLNRSRD